GQGCSAMSTGLTMTVNPLPVANLVSSDADNIICAGAPVTFTATPSGANIYALFVNGSSVASSASRTYTTSTLNNGDEVHVVVTSTSGCEGTSTAIETEVTPAPTTANAGLDQLNLCGVTSTTLTANTPANGAGSWSVV